MPEQCWRSLILQVFYPSQGLDCRVPLIQRRWAGLAKAGECRREKDDGMKMTTPWEKFQGSLEIPADSGGASGFESLPLTPPRTVKDQDESQSASPRFASLPPIRTERTFSFNQGGTAIPSPLGAPAFPNQGGGDYRYSRVLPSSPSPVVTAEREYRGALSRNSSFNYSSDKLNRSPHASDKPPIPIFTRTHSSKTTLSRTLSMSKDSLAPNSLNRLLSLEKGENWKWSPNSDDVSRDDLYVSNEMEYEMASNKSHQDASSLTIGKILKYGSSSTKKLFVLIILNFAYSATEFLIGLFTSQIGLVSDSFHLTFGCGVLTFSLVAMVLSKNSPDSIYTYGYKRLEVLAGFTNALFLLFLSFSLAVEALHAFVQDESEHKHYLIISAVANLTVNLIGVWFFRSYARVRVVYRKAEDINNHSICLHVLSDSIRSAGVVLASWLLTLGVKYAETLCLGLVAVAVFSTTMPLFVASGGVLLQMAPSGVSPSALMKCQRQILLLDEVVDCYKARFWDIVPGGVVGTLVIQVKPGADEQKILKHVHSVFNDIGVKDLTVQIESSNHDEAIPRT
ncbi:hypothetical protein MPTK1_2g04970 [Marchantia polymorpha subsp. ruderalis]|uniref:Cation efflux protein transmembrane domain-containing protein n=1 Tax=Marchantia polymorpha TaxID=3197 RepID=A0A2R6X7W6_MARPO|nr:hypothetical protein MARPO_0031s0152 [Marchantia polymorpha]BBN01138.1 hypothetical protein Mp_2g04970 [Marchantia polymorpha subsp. ruderalis]|eukprot:PTQ42187.1 hypothetical protein MARPO_0031s0152 [Marchantia polymorpha]